MFGFARRKSRRQLVRAELTNSLSHLRRAANYAAGGVGTAVGPRVSMARGYVVPVAARVGRSTARGWGSTMTVITPLAMSAVRSARMAEPGRGRARQAGSDTRRAKMRTKAESAKKRPSKMTRLLVIGAVAAIGAAAMRRRRRHQWEEYDPGAALEAVRSDAGPVIHSSPADSMSDGPGVGSQAEAARGPAKAQSSTTGGTRQAAGKSGERDKDVLGTTTDAKPRG